jgi:hypothetical protein
LFNIVKKIIKQMNKVFITILVLASFLKISFAQKSDNKVEVIVCSDFKITKRLQEIADSLPAYKELIKEFKKESEDRKNRIPYFAKKNSNALPLVEDPAVQKKMGTRQSQGIIDSWDGLSGLATPPDPTGAAGTDYYVQAVNSSYQIFTKTGGNVTGGGPFTLGSLLFGSNDGDPIVLYDKYADRWIITEFKVFGKRVLFAVSVTNDPTGQYYTYQFTSPQFPDYQKFSIWSDGYYMTSNQTSQKVFVFERDSMLAGVSTSRSIYKTFTPPKSTGFFCPLPADADGQLPPAGTPCPIFSYEDDGWGTTFSDRINVFEMSVDWGATPTATIDLVAQLPTQAFDGSYDQNWNDISQPGTSQKLDGIGGVFTFRAQYRRWTGYNTVVLNKGVKVNTTTGQRSIRWYELRQNTTTGEWSIYQQSTYAPDELNRWVGSIAMDDNGSISLAYSVSDAVSVYPSIRYTGRLANDPLNEMTFAEVTVVEGNSSQTSNNRFGDYSHTALDPVDGTLFWHTGEYIKNGQPATRIFSFRLPANNVSISDNLKEKEQLNVYFNGNEININANSLPYNKEINVDLFDISGKLIEGKIINVVNNTLSTYFNAQYLKKGTYLVRIGYNNTSFQKVAKVLVN